MYSFNKVMLKYTRQLLFLFSVAVDGLAELNQMCDSNRGVALVQ